MKSTASPRGQRDGKESLAEQAYRHLCNRIIEGSIEYGESLNIRQIAAYLRMSSMPVREAMKRLEIEGVVTIKPRSVCRVKIPTRQSILSALEMRELLEIHCVETHYPTVTAAELRDLHRLVETMKAITAERTPPVKRYIAVDREFHTRLCALAQNDYIDKSYRETSLHLNMRHIYSLSIPPDIPRTFREHAELVEALAQNSRRAVAIIKRHLARSRRNVLQGALLA